MATATSPCPAPAPAELDSIAALRDPVIRNLRITECYHRLSLALTARTGDCANWCTFATWASRQAGATVRGEDMLARLDTLLRRRSLLLHPIRTLWRIVIRRGLFYPETRIGRLVQEIHTPFDAFERASDAVARGNLKVFAEIAREFARYMATCPASAPIDSPEFAQFASTLKPGEPPEGQEYLRRAFTLYQQQAFESDPIRRSQMLYFANVLIGRHEQSRLQPEIREALESAPETARRLGARPFLLLLFGPAADGLARFARELTCRVVTDCLMVLWLPPDLRLELGHNLDRPSAKDLETISLTELEELLRPYSAEDCGANDWSDIEQRMRYIARLFRCFHAESALFRPPFTAEQSVRILTGAIPFGEL